MLDSTGGPADTGSIQACWTAQAFMLHIAITLDSAGILAAPSQACDAEQAVLAQRVCCQLVQASMTQGGCATSSRQR